MTAGSSQVQYRVTIRQAGREVAVASDETILAAALAAGVAYPFGCQSGNCAACKSRLLRGDVDLLPHNDYALTEAERTQGLILACRAVPRSDAAVAWLELDETIQHPLRQLDCAVTEVVAATHDITVVRLRIARGGPFDFRPGQYAAVRFAGQPDRDFSMATPPAGEVIEFHVRAVADGTVSRFVATSLRPGDRVGVTGPMGFAFLRDSHRGPIIAVAGGSGLAPMKAIVEAALAQGLAQPIHLYFGARTQRDLYLVEHFQALAHRHDNLRYDVVLSEAGDPAPFRGGFLHDALAADYADLDGAKLYVAGPPPMVDAVAASGRRLGVRVEDIHADPFYAAHELPRAGSGSVSGT